MPTLNDKSAPQGFTITKDQATQEARISGANDAGRQDNTKMDLKPHPGLKLQFASSVDEEERLNPFASNDSLQRVFLNLKSDGVAVAGLTSTRGEKHTTLSGDSNGRVIVSQFDLSLPLSSSHVRVDITDQAALAGITAAGIRRTQKDIAADGEVTRPTSADKSAPDDQGKIKGMIDKAKAMAGLR